MSVTTTDAVYREILERLKAQLTIADSFIYVCPTPIFSVQNETSVQIIPGNAEVIHPETGIGLIREEFDVCVWTRVLLDSMQESTMRLIDGRRGVLSMMTDVRNAMIQHDLQTGVEPITWRRSARPAESPEQAGWVLMFDTYRVGYEVEWQRI